MTPVDPQPQRITEIRGRCEQAAVWRSGEHYGIHVYEGDRPVATFHTVVDARTAVQARSDLSYLLERLEQVEAENQRLRATNDQHEAGQQPLATLAAWLLETYKAQGIALWLTAYLDADEVKRRTLLLRAHMDPMGG